jgi:hypothetical protein
VVVVPSLSMDLEMGSAQLQAYGERFLFLLLVAVALLSTHDQLLGGPMGTSLLGSVFPADPAYAVAITRDARKIGERPPPRLT